MGSEKNEEGTQVKKSRISAFVVAILLTTSLSALGPLGQAHARSSHAPGSITVPTDTEFHLRLNQALNSRTAKKGDTFTASVIEPVVVRGVTAVSEGSTVYGRVTTVTRARRGHSGTMGVSFYRLRLPSNQTLSILGSLASLENEKADRGDGQESEVRGRSLRRTLILIGGGAGVGAIIGAAAGGGKGAGIGAAIGGGAGTAAALLTKGNEVNVKPGTTITMALDRPVTVPMSR
jgi:type IV secretion system protein VirB10